MVVQLSWAKTYPHRDSAKALTDNLEYMASTCKETGTRKRWMRHSRTVTGDRDVAGFANDNGSGQTLFTTLTMAHQLYQPGDGRKMLPRSSSTCGEM